VSLIESTEPKGVKGKMRQLKLKSRVNWCKLARNVKKKRKTSGCKTKVGSNSSHTLVQIYQTTECRLLSDHNLHPVLWLYTDGEFKTSRTSAWEDFIEFRNSVVLYWMRRMDRSKLWAVFQLNVSM